MPAWLEAVEVEVEAVARVASPGPGLLVSVAQLPAEAAGVAERPEQIAGHAAEPAAKQAGARLALQAAIAWIPAELLMPMEECFAAAQTVVESYLEALRQPAVDAWLTDHRPAQMACRGQVAC